MTDSLSVIARKATHQMFSALPHCLDKAAAYAQGRGIEEEVLLSMRLAPDMLPMKRQVQIACDIPARGLARLAGAALPSFPDEETTLEGLKQRVSRTRSFIADLDDAAIDADPDGDLTFPAGKEEMTMSRIGYFSNFLLPNLYFHCTTTYAILRHAGVPLGKRDFLHVG